MYPKPYIHIHIEISKLASNRVLCLHELDDDPPDEISEPNRSIFIHAKNKLKRKLFRHLGT